MFDFRDFFYEHVKNIAVRLKKYHKSERHSCLVTNIFIKLLQNMCLIIRTFWLIIMPDVTASYDFTWVFSHTIDDNSCKNCCSSTKLSHIVCTIDTLIM